MLLFSTLPFSTMHTAHKCGQVYVVNNILSLQKALKLALDPIIIGGGSNILFTQDTTRDLIVNDIRGIEIESKNDHEVLIKIGAGEIWHEFVMWALEHDFGGVENLSLIPGKCGAAPMQNIGAYGVELGDVLHYVDVMNKEDGEESRMAKEACQLGYRDSIFKKELRNKVVITAIGIKLTLPGSHQLCTNYGDISNQLIFDKISNPTIQDISRAVISIRKSKLPDPLVLPNCGSFFKNPIVPKIQYEEVLKLFPDMPAYLVDSQFVKIPAGWLIDKAGWKGKQIGMVGTHEHQALVIVNYGAKDGGVILDFAKQIQSVVLKIYGIRIEAEVNVY